MNNPKNSTLHEITPLSEVDCIYVIERHKTEFNFPIHTHKEFEINYIENARGALRVVGDSIVDVGDYDLILISNDNLEHAWQNHNCTTNDIREITIQFSGDWLSEKLLSKNQFYSINQMLQQGRKGVAFSLATILKVRSLLNSLTCQEKGFYLVINFLSLLYELSVASDSYTLASSSFARAEGNTRNNYVRIVDNFIKDNYTRNITLKEVAGLVNMSNATFCRFFNLHTGKSFTEYLTDIRIGRVTRMLVDTSKTIAEICYDCGYNNMSNFNRIFKKKKGCSPREFREMYRKRQVIA